MPLILYQNRKQFQLLRIHQTEIKTNFQIWFNVEAAMNG